MTELFTYLNYQVSVTVGQNAGTGRWFGGFMVSKDRRIEFRAAAVADDYASFDSEAEAVLGTSQTAKATIAALISGDLAPQT